MKRIALVAMLVISLGAPAWSGTKECVGKCYKECVGNYGNRHRDYLGLVSACEPFARKGIPEAQEILGMLYQEGSKSRLPNYSKAAKWFRAAAEQGHSGAQWWLANLYVRGRGVLQDYEEAIKWYMRAVEQGEAFAYWDLGKMYRDGKGVPQDYVLAHMWLNLTAAQGYPVAAVERDALAKKMTTADISKAQKLAREWMEKHGE